ncbi:MAG: hypothetical protein MI919_31190, partial [Holophagales bacterium]|nr:hypothetical protein [Holophagales bacterium]
MRKRATWTLLAAALTATIPVLGSPQEPVSDGHPFEQPCSADGPGCDQGELITTILELPDGSEQVVRYRSVDGRAVVEGDILLNIDEAGIAR